MLHARIPNRLQFIAASALLLLLSCSQQGVGLLFSFDVNAPDNLSISASGRDVSLSWDPVEEADSYTAYRYTNSGCAFLPNSYSECDQATRWSRINSTSINDVDLENGTSYYYRVLAHGADDDSELSEEISIAIEAALPPGVAEDIQKSVEVGEVRFQWTGGANSDYYVIYRVTDIQGQNCVIPDSFASCGDADEAMQSSQLDANQSSWADSSISDGQSYYYTIVSYNDYGSTNSDSFFVRTIPDSPLVTSTSFGNDGLQLQWNERLGASYYQLYRYSVSDCLNASNINDFGNCSDALLQSELSGTGYLDDVGDILSTNIYYRLRSGNSNGLSNLSEEYYYNLELSPPDEFNLTTNGSAHSLHWSEILRATGYSLYRYSDISCSLSPDTCPNVLVVNLAADVFSYTDDSAIPGVFYYYSIRGRDGTNWSAYSQAQSTYTSPLAVSNLQATASEQQVDLSWDANANAGDTVYTVYRFECSPELSNCGTSTIAGTVNVAERSDGASSFIDSGLANAQQYYYLISSSVEGWELNSSLANATTDPKPLTSLTVAVVDGYSVRLGWNNPDDNKDDASYSIYIYSCLPDSSGCDPERVDNLGTGEILIHDVERLVPGSHYYFRAGVSANSIEYNTTNVNAYTPPLAPDNISYEPEVDQITISWEANNGNAATYEVESYACSEELACAWDQSIQTPNTATSFVYKNLTPGKVYPIRVRARSGSYEVVSGEVDALTMPLAPDPDLASQFELLADHNAITINWDASINSSDAEYTPIRYPCDLANEDDCTGLPLMSVTGSNYLTQTDENLASGSLYSYKIMVRNRDLYAYSTVLSEITAPLPPSSVNVIGGDRMATVTWEPLGTEVPEYDLYQSQYDCSSEDLLNSDIDSCGNIEVTQGIMLEENAEFVTAELTGLQPSTKYYYNIKAYNPSNDLYSFTVGSEAVITWPEAPKTIEWESQTSGITLSWSTDDNGVEATWRLYRYSCDPDEADCTTDDYEKNFAYTITSYEDDININPAHLYYYVISAIADGNELKSDPISTLSSPNDLDDLIASSAVDNNSSTAIDAASAGLYVDLNWSNNGNDIDTVYTVYRMPCSEEQKCGDIYQFGSYTGLTNYGVRNSHEEKDAEGYKRDLDPATLYTYIVNMSISDVDSSIEVDGNTSIEVITHPVAISDLSASEISSSSVKLEWDDDANGAQISYSIYINLCPDDSGASCIHVSTHEGIEAKSYTATELTPGSYHSFVIRSLAGEAGSIDSEHLDSVVTEPEAVSDIVATVSANDSGGTELTTSWISANGSATWYNRRLYICTSNSNCSLLITEEGIDYSYNDSSELYIWKDNYQSFESGKVYEVAIAAETDSGEISADAVRFSAMPIAPGNLITEVVSDTSIILRWTNTGMHTGSDVYAFTGSCTNDELAADVSDTSENVCGIAASASITNGNSSIINSGNTYSYDFEFTNLVPGTQYNFTAKTNNDSGSIWAANDDRQMAITHPLAVGDITSSSTSNTIDISWNANGNGAKSSYSVYAFKRDCLDSCILLAGYPVDVGTDTNHSITGLLSGSSYRVYIATEAGGVEVNASAVNFLTVPLVPSNLIATLGSASPTDSIKLVWDTANINNGAATNYQFLRFSCLSDDCSNNDVNISLSADDFDAGDYTDDSLDSGSGYQYILQAYNSVGEANSNVTQTITTNTSAVTSITTSNISDNSMVVGFDIPESNGPETAYKVYFGTCTSSVEDDCSDFAVTTLSSGQTELEVDELQPAQYYGIIIAAIIDNSESNSSTVIAATLPDAFTDISSSALDQNISLDYSSANGSAGVYRVYLYEYVDSETKEVSDNSPLSIGSASSTYTLDSLRAGTEYDIVVAVSNGDWTNEVNSTLVSSTTYPLAVSDLKADAEEQGILLSWTNGADPDNLNGAATIHVIYRYECDPSLSDCSTAPFTTNATSSTGYESAGLDFGEDYHYVVGAQAGGIEANTTILTASTLPAALSNVKTYGLESDSTSIQIDYDSVNGNSSTYKAYRFTCGTDTSACTTEGAPDATIELDVSGGIDSGLQAATYYRYLVGVSSGGQELNASANADALTAPEPPELISDNVSSAEKSINISSYTIPAGVIDAHYLVLTEDECSGEDLETSNTSSCGVISSSPSGDNTDINFTNLSANSDYFLRSVAENNTAKVFSETLTFTTLPETPSLGMIGIDLGMQIRFDSDDTEQTSYTFMLADTDCSDAAEDGDCSFDFTFSDISPGFDFSLTDANTTDGYFTQATEYFGAVKATNSAGSSYTRVESATTVPAAPADIVATGGIGQLTFNWTKVAGVSNYHLRAYNNSCDASYMDSSHDGTIGTGEAVQICGLIYAANVDYLLSEGSISNGLLNGRSYFYRLGSSNEIGNANWSEEGSAFTLPSPPTNLQASNLTDVSVVLSWNTGNNETITRQDLYRYTMETTCTVEQLLDLVEDLGGATGVVNNDTNCGNFSYTQSIVSGTEVTVLDSSTTYYFRIAAVNDAGPSLSEYLEVTTTAQSGSQSSAIEINEPLQSEQWYLTNTGQKAYAGYAGIANFDINHSGALELGFTGANIRVNVIDTGMEMQHPDLLANIVPDGSYDYVDDDNDPSNYDDTDGDHGTSVAGLIAADDNGAGITGVAPDALLQAFNYLRSSQSTADYLLAHGGDTKLDDTAIFNKSLGVAVSYDYRVNSTRLEALSCFTSGGATDHESPENCSEALRSGLGAIYVKAAGNDFSATATDELCLSFGLSCRDANMDAEHAYPYQVVVGALNASGTKSSYSNAGSALWLTAPAGEYGWDYDFINSELSQYSLGLTPDPDNPIWYPAMLTTDQVGCERGNTTYRYDFETSGVPPIGVTQFHEDDTLNPDCDYSSTFNGTSAATPVASGVIALMLEANANLSWRDVKHILAASSDVTDASIAEVSIPVLLCSTDCSDGQYTASDSLEFIARDSWQTNAAGYDFHNWYGFGAVNAGAAVAMAQSYASQLGQWQKLSVSQSFNQVIPDATGSALQVSINQPDDFTVEAVQLDLQIDHSYLGDLSVVLVSPSGTRSVLLTPFGLYDDDIDFDANLLSNAFYGEAAAGDWQLQIYDLMQADTGSLVSATLNVYGH